ncbi:MAG: phosphatidate cytidylyltransferase [Elusimicrobiota bacterium]
MVLPRLLTALAAAPIFLWVLHLGGPPFAVFMFFLVLLAAWEFHLMAEEGGYAGQSWWGVAAAGLVALALIFPGLRPDMALPRQAPALAVASAIFVLFARELARGDKSLSMLRLGTSLSGLFLVAWPLGHLILLRDLRGPGDLFQVGRGAAFFLVLLIWAQDVAAWAAGRALGRHRLAPQVSPGKTWEGGAAGLAAAVLAGLAAREFFLAGAFSRGEAAALAAVLGVLAQFSDLAESLMKRCFGVKDSSQLLPGHGGVLDRFDSFLFSAPFLYFYLIITGRAG